jgi:hypothetical protein
LTDAYIPTFFQPIVLDFDLPCRPLPTFSVFRPRQRRISSNTIACILKRASPSGDNNFIICINHRTCAFVPFVQVLKGFHDFLVALFAGFH